MALIDTKNLPKAEVGKMLNAQENAQKKVVSNPFANLNIDPIKVEQESKAKTTPQQVNTHSFQRTQTPVQQSNNTFSNNAINHTKRTSTGRTLKTTPAGNTYTYEDVYNHLGDVKVKKEQESHYDLRIPVDMKKEFMAIAKAKSMSFNQLVLRAVKDYISRY